MSQTETGKATAADEPTEAARSFVRTVKVATRRKYTPDDLTPKLASLARRVWP